MLKSGGVLSGPLRVRDYRMLWLGQLISVMGDKVDQIALGILVYSITGSGLQMGITLAISMVPAALLGLVAGAYVDRFDNRRTMLAADLARALLVVAVPFAADVHIALVYVIALVTATVSLFFEPAKLSLIPKLVPEEQLMAANSLDNATVSIAELAGLAFAAGVVATLGYRLAFFFNSATFLVSAVFVWAIRHRETRATPVGRRFESMRAEVVDGLRYITRHESLRDLLVIYSVASTALAASVTFLYVLALERFRAGAPGLALMDGAITVGLLVGSVLVGRTDREDAPRTLLAGLGCFSVLLALLTVAPSVAWAVPVLLLSGAANMFFYVPMSTILQTMTMPSMRGRTFSAKQALSRIFAVGGFLVAGVLVDTIGLSSSILTASAVAAVAAGAGWLRQRAWRATETAPETG